MPYGITLCNLPPDTGENPTFTPSRSGMQGWVDLCYVKATGRELNQRPVICKSYALLLSHHITHDEGPDTSSGTEGGLDGRLQRTYAWVYCAWFNCHHVWQTNLFTTVRGDSAMQALAKWLWILVTFFYCSTCNIKVTQGLPAVPSDGGRGITSILIRGYTIEGIFRGKAPEVRHSSQTGDWEKLKIHNCEVFACFSAALNQT